MKKLAVVLLAFLFFIFACYLTPCMKIADIAPDFMLILLATLMPHCGILTLLLLAAVLGTALDSTLSGGVYINTAVYFCSAVAFGVLRHFMPGNHFISSGIAVVGATVFKYLVSMFALYVLNIHRDLSILYFIKSVPAALYNAALTVPIAFAFKYLFAWSFLQQKDPDDRYIV